MSHAVGTLEQMVQTAQNRQFAIFCLTEHMPRLEDAYLYPEEIDKQYTKTELENVFSEYLEHARTIQKRVNGQSGMRILVGFEVEGINEAHIEAAANIAKVTDMSVGSVHHVHGIPIDFDSASWLRARAVSGSTRALYRDYFDLQHKVVSRVRPDVIGHFDLIRLFEPDDMDPSTGKKASEIDVESDWPEVWLAIVRNIDYMVSYGALFELNSAAIRKGWTSPYPRVDIARAIAQRGGRFCLSDDSHSYEQIGMNYHKVWGYVVDVLKLEFVYHLDLDGEGKTVVVEDSVEELTKSPFWRQY